MLLSLQTYNVFSDGVLEYAGLARRFLFRRLDPATRYTLTLEACTAAGCARSAPQAAWTADAPPRAQPAPTARSVRSTSVQLAWAAPVHPNGRITRYEVIRRCPGGEARGSQTALAAEKVVCTEHDAERSAFACNDTGLRPWTLCRYKIRAWNSAGHTGSPWIAVRTLQAPPAGLSPPEVTCVRAHPPALLVAWTPPAQPNGRVQAYRLHRDPAPSPLSFDAAARNYTDRGLRPFCTYSYAVTACTGGGCATSRPASLTTPEAAPAGLGPPDLRAVSATQINASWAPPSTRNGRITKYSLRCADGQEYLAGQSLSLLVPRLRPFTQYNFSLVACTSAGCTTSASRSAWTMEAPPQDMDPPKLQVTGSASIEITWKPPRNPNGQIRSYELRRDGSLVYTGLETHYHDFMLAPGVEYGYTVTASNSRGGILSPLVTDRTSPSAPSGMEPPKLQPKGPHEISVSWDPPVKANGRIVNYTLLVRELFEGETKTIGINATHDSFGTRAFVVKQLQPFHR